MITIYVKVYTGYLRSSGTLTAEPTFNKTALTSVISQDLEATSGNGYSQRVAPSWYSNAFIRNACLYFLLIFTLTTDHGVTGSIPGTSTNWKCGLGLERGPSSIVRTIGYLLDWEVADLIKSTLLYLTVHNANHIIPSCCHLPVSCRCLLIGVAPLEAVSYRFIFF